METSISHWLQGLATGESAAMQELWESFSTRLTDVARKQLRRSGVNPADGTDVVASVFESVWAAAQSGRLKSIKDIDELLWLLLAITKRKCIDAARRAKAERRGGNRPFASVESDPRELYKSIVSTEPDPVYVTALNEEYNHLLERLGERTLKQITILMVEGFTCSEIAQLLKLSEATVRRKRSVIRRVLASELNHD